MSEWLGRTKITYEDIKKATPSILECFPMLAKYYVDDQKFRIILILDYDEGDRFKEITRKVYGSLTPTTVREAAREAVTKWMEAHA